MRNSSITRLVIRTAVAVGMAVIVVSAIGCAVAQPPVEATEFSSQKALTIDLRFRKLTSGSLITSSSEAISLTGRATD